MNNYNIHPRRSWKNPYFQQKENQERLIPFLTGAVISAPFWWATRPPAPYPYPVPYPYPTYPRYRRRPYYYPFRPFY